MKKINRKRGISGAKIGSIIGGALGTLLAGVTLCIPRLNIVIAPVAPAAAATAATTVTVSGAALGTVVEGYCGRYQRRGRISQG